MVVTYDSHIGIGNSSRKAWINVKDIRMDLATNVTPVEGIYYHHHHHGVLEYAFGRRYKASEYLEQFRAWVVLQMCHH
jgi:hypothetical protein